MPLPPDDDLDKTINRLYDDVLVDAMQPARFGMITGLSAQLHAASQRRLTLAIERATAAQEHTNRRIERLERVAIWVAIAGLIFAAVQVGLAIWQRSPTP